MGSQKHREQRRPVLVTCRLRDDSGWSDVTICNLSDHGLMARCNDAPRRGAFVELRKGAVTIVGQVRWSRDGRIGIRTQERIDIGSVLDEAPALRPTNDRRLVAREAVARPAAPTPAELAARSRRWARRFDWLVVVAIGAVSAGILAGQVHDMFSAPLEKTKAALAA